MKKNQKLLLIIPAVFLINNSFSKAFSVFLIHPDGHGVVYSKTDGLTEDRDTLKQKTKIEKERKASAALQPKYTDVPCNGKDPDMGPCNVDSVVVIHKKPAKSGKSGKVSNAKIFDWKAYTADTSNARAVLNDR